MIFFVWSFVAIVVLNLGIHTSLVRRCPGSDVYMKDNHRNPKHADFSTENEGTGNLQSCKFWTVIQDETCDVREYWRVEKRRGLETLGRFVCR